jgi:hypothetical protein
MECGSSIADASALGNIAGRGYQRPGIPEMRSCGFGHDVKRARWEKSCPEFSGTLFAAIVWKANL